MSNWQNKDSQEEGAFTDFKERLSFAKKTPDKLAIISEAILNLADSIFIRIGIAVFALYLIWLILV